jgi:uncharacterized protein (UPF0276 family)
MVLRQMFPEVSRLAGYVDFFQVPGEEYFGPATIQDVPSIEYLSKIKPLHIHSIDLSIGSHHGPDKEILQRIAEVTNNMEIVTFSDHLGFSQTDKHWTGMSILNPPLTFESADQMVQNIKKIKEVIGNKPFYIENNSHCIEWPNSTMTEAAYTNYVVKKSGAGILLDIPNMLADARNFDFDPYAFIDSLDKSKVKMLHIAGGDWLDGYKRKEITRGHHMKVEDETWELLKYTLKKCAPDYIILERARNINYDEIISDLTALREIVSV